MPRLPGLKSPCYGMVGKATDAGQQQKPLKGKQCGLVGCEFNRGLISGLFIFAFFRVGFKQQL